MDSIPLQLSPDVSVRYDPARDVYIFSYKRFDGRVVHKGFELATKVDVIVEGRVESTSDKNSGFHYSYTLHSLPNSKQGVYWFAIITDDPIKEATAPDTGWTVRIPPKPLRITQGKPGVSWSDGKIRTDVPLPSLPVFTDEMAKVWSDTQRKEEPPVPAIPHVSPIRLGVAPGKRLEGFAFISPRLPGIVRCYARGAQFMAVTHGEPPPEVENLTLENTFLAVEGRTVGPVLENPPNDPLKVLNQLIAWVREGEQLGWASKTLVEQTVSRLEKSRAYWAAGKRREAAEELAGIIAVADQEKEVSITSELYAILRFNSEALRALALIQ